MTPSEIITADAQRNGVNPNSVITKMEKLLKSKKAIMLQHGDSVLIIRKFGDGLAELHIFTTDTPREIINAIKTFISKIKKSDIQTVYGNADNNQIIRVLKSLGVIVQNSDIDGYNWKADVWAQ
jgi:Icc-related predicted phosphoesterase